MSQYTESPPTRTSGRARTAPAENRARDGLPSHKQNHLRPPRDKQLTPPQSLSFYRVRLPPGPNDRRLERIPTDDPDLGSYVDTGRRVYTYPARPGDPSRPPPAHETQGTPHPTSNSAVGTSAPVDDTDRGPRRSWTTKKVDTDRKSRTPPEWRWSSGETDGREPGTG